MTRHEFEVCLQDLRGNVLGAIERHFTQRNLAFNVVRFLEAAEVSLEQSLREAYFHGAEIFPIDDLPR